MITQCVNWIKRIGEKLPIIKKYVHRNISSNAKNQDLELSKKTYIKNQNLTLETENKKLCIQNIKPFLEEEEQRGILQAKFPELNERIKHLISKISPTAPVSFKEKQLIALIEEYQEKLNSKFEEELNKLNNVSYDSSTPQKYIELWTDYILETKRLTLESTNTLIFNTVKLENANDIDLMSALLFSREITKQIAQNSLNQMSESLSNIPIGYDVNVDSKQTSLRDILKESFKEENIDLFLVSKFGMFSGDLVNRIFSILENNSDQDGKELFENLSIISKFQQAIQGSLLQEHKNLKSNNHSIGMINPRIVKRAFEKLSSLYDSYIKLRSTYIDLDLYHKQKNEIIGKIKDIKQFIYELGVTENTEFNTLKQIKNENILEKMNLDSIEATNKILNAYKNVHQIANNLGIMQAEEIMGIGFHKTPLINLFNMEKEETIDHTKRIMLEVSLLAGIKVILTHINPANKDIDFSKLRMNKNNKTLPASLNFESIPWLKNYYHQKVQNFEDKVSRDNSTFKIAPVIKEISNIGKELLKSNLFTASDFFARYGLHKEDEELLSIVGDMTEIGRMSLNIGFVTNFLSYLNYDEKCPMTKQEIINLQLLIKYLNEKSKIFDKEGKEIYAPAGKDQKLENLYDELKKEIGAKDFLALNAPLITNFIKKCFGQDVKPPRKIKEDSFEANNQVLASWLFYILVKFLPEKSSHIDSLKARSEIIKIVLDQDFQKECKVNPSLFKKMIKQARGLSELGPFASTRGRKGIVKDLCLDLENHLKLHQNNKSSIPLKDILNIYADLEKVFQKNPKSYQKIQEVQKNIFKNNEALLKPLENELISLYPIKPAIVIEFVKEQKTTNPKLFHKFTFDLLEKINKQLYSVKLGETNIIKDSEEAKVKLLLQTLEDIFNLGFVINDKPNQKIELAKDSFDLGLGEKTIKESLNSLNKFLKSKIIIEEDQNITNEKEAYPEQYKTITELKKLLDRFGFDNSVRLNTENNEASDRFYLAV